LSTLGDYLKATRGMGSNARRYLLFTALSSVGWAIAALCLNLYLHAIGYRQDFIGLLNGLPSMVVIIVGLPIGVLADRRGYLRFIVFGTALNTLASLGLALSVSKLSLLTFAVIGGAAGSAGWILGAPFLMSITNPRERVFLFSLQSAVMTGTGFLGSLMGGAIPRLVAGRLGMGSMDVLPLRLALLAIVLFNAVSLVPLAGMRETRRTGAAGSDVGEVGAAARNAASNAASGAGSVKAAGPFPRSRAELALYLKLLSLETLVALGAGAMVTFFQLFFNLRFHLPPERIAPIFAFSAVGTTLATLITPLLARRFGRVRTVVMSQLASVPFLLTLAYSTSLPAVIAAYYLRDALMNMVWPVQQTFVLEQVAENQRATLTSLSAILGSMGRGGLGPIISGYLQVVSGFSLAFTFTTVCYVVGAALFWYFFRNAEAASPAADWRHR